jgi:2-oxoglutarate ferredoxin oxidoreductase subunit alpha
MTPVFILTDAFLANGSEPWMIPSLDDLPPIKFSYAEARDGQYMPYERDEETLARRWAIPGMSGLEHRIGGLEREHISGNVSYDPDNHDLMVRLRAEKVAGMTREIPPTEVYGDATGDLLVLGWGSTYGAIRTSVEALRSEGKSVSHAHLKWLNPLPADLGEHLLKFQKVLIPEVNSGQLIKLIRSEFLIDAEGLNLVRGKPFRKSQIIAKVKEIL